MSGPIYGEYYKHARFRKIFIEKETEKRQYATRRADCRDCPLKEECIGKGTEKRFSVVNQLGEYERAIARVNSRKGQYYKRKRQSTVEPVIGVLTQFMGIRKVNTRGINNANKQFLMAAIAYNLKKYLKFDNKKVQTLWKEAIAPLLDLYYAILRLLGSLFTFPKPNTKIADKSLWVTKFLQNPACP